MGAVGDGSEQLRAQHNRAALASGASDTICAFAQQSMMPIIGHSISPERIGVCVPADTPQDIAVRRTKDVSHFAIAVGDYIVPVSISVKATRSRITRICKTA